MWVFHNTERMNSDSWEAADRLLRRILAHIDDIALEVTNRIREEFGDYALVPFEEHRAGVTAQLRRRVEAFRDRRPWHPPDIKEIEELARRRARQGISVEAFIFAYHVSDRELWRHLVSAPGDAFESLPEITSLMLESLQAMTTALAAAHNAESRAQRGLRTAAAQRLLSRLSTHHVDAETKSLALFFGFDLGQEYTAVAWRPSGRLAMTPEFQVIVESLPDAVVAHAQFPSDYLIVIQGAETWRWRALVERLGVLGFVGVGSTRDGIESTPTSIGQARLALTSASSSQPTSFFTERWLESCATSQLELIEAEIAHAVAVATNNPALAHTIRQFAASDMSIARCAREHHLHPNTVSYRIARWLTLTGWNPRDFSDLSKSVVACVIAEQNSDAVEA